MVEFVDNDKKRLIIVFADGTEEFILNYTDVIEVSHKEEISLIRPYVVVVELCDSVITVNGKNILE